MIMREQDIKRNLNKQVKFTDPSLHIDSTEYILTAAIFRRGEKGFFYQAELTDRTCRNSVVICKLDQIEAIDD